MRLLGLRFPGHQEKPCGDEYGDSPPGSLSNGFFFSLLPARWRAGRAWLRPDHGCPRPLPVFLWASVAALTQRPRSRLPGFLSVRDRPKEDEDRAEDLAAAFRRSGLSNQTAGSASVRHGPCSPCTPACASRPSRMGSVFSQGWLGGRGMRWATEEPGRCRGPATSLGGHSAGFLRQRVV